MQRKWKLQVTPWSSDVSQSFTDKEKDRPRCRVLLNFALTRGINVALSRMGLLLSHCYYCKYISFAINTGNLDYAFR